jgi:Domain of unknown function (DUF222)/HNH endonuclease
VVDGLLADLADTAWNTASEDELLAAAVDIETWTRKLYGIAVAVTGELDTRRVAPIRGVTSTVMLLQQLLRISPAQAQRRVADARAVCPRVQITGEVSEPALPAAAAALREGTLSADHLRVVRGTLADLPTDTPAEVRSAVEERLVTDAADLDPVQLGKAARRIRAHLDPDGAQLNERQAVARRELTLTPDLDGTVLIRGRLDAEGAAIVQAALDPLATPRPADPVSGKDVRSPARRRADALVQASRMLLNTRVLPTTGGQRPHLNITINLNDLTNSTGTADVDNTDAGISAAAARRHACDAHIIPHVLGNHSEPLDIGRASYSVPPPMRRALIIRDKGCAFPGCDRPPGWCEAHHIQSWLDGGDTALTNLALLCDYHHERVHAQNWHIHIINGHPEFTPPEWLAHHHTPLRNTTHHPPDREPAA